MMLTLKHTNPQGRVVEFRTAYSPEPGAFYVTTHETNEGEPFHDLPHGWVKRRAPGEAHAEFVTVTPETFEDECRKWLDRVNFDAAPRQQWVLA